MQDIVVRVLCFMFLQDALNDFSIGGSLFCDYCRQLCTPSELNPVVFLLFFSEKQLFNVCLYENKIRQIYQVFFPDIANVIINHFLAVILEQVGLGEG